MKNIDITGQRFSRLIAIKYFESRIQPNGKSRAYWLFRCDCGKEKLIEKHHVKRGKIKSCGCLGRKLTSIRNRLAIKHGFFGTRFYRTFHGLKTRCENPKYKGHKNYGARGIKVLWENFEEFKEDMYESFLEHIELHGNKNTQIDRINVDGNYSKGNCRWVTIKEQANNKRKTAY